MQLSWVKPWRQSWSAAVTLACSAVWSVCSLNQTCMQENQTLVLLEAWICTAQIFKTMAVWVTWPAVQSSKAREGSRDLARVTHCQQCLLWCSTSYLFKVHIHTTFIRLIILLSLFYLPNVLDEEIINQDWG